MAKMSEVTWLICETVIEHLRDTVIAKKLQKNQK